MSSRDPRWIALSCAALVATLGIVPAPTWANPCGPITSSYGPYDYRRDKDKLEIVERFHFGPSVQALTRGQSGSLGGDLDYTLRAFPNHHLALNAVLNFGLKASSVQPPGLPRPVECYFERAIRFQPEDAVVRVLYSQFLVQHKRTTEALAQLESASLVAEDHAAIHEGIGLAFAELKQYDRARASAQRAMALDRRPERLIEMLKAAGQWSEPAEAAASGTAR